MPKAETQRTIKCGTLYRSHELKRGEIDRESRTVPLAFSSELPVGRWFGKEVLDHAPKSVRLGRLQNGGAVLMDHATRDQVGVVENVEIGGDRVGRAVVRFGRSARAEEIFNDVVDGIRRHVSVGYVIHEMMLEKSSDEDGEQYRATDWEPYEISFVSVPADPTVGVARDADQNAHEIIIRGLPAEPTKKENIMPEVTTPTAAEIEAGRQSAAKDAVTAERSRISEIEKMAGAFADVPSIRDMAAAAISAGTPVADFQRQMIDELAKKKPAPTADLGMNRSEVKAYSFLRAMRALAFPTERKFQQEAAYEREVSEAAAKAAGKASQGLMVPMDVLRAPLLDASIDPQNALIRAMLSKMTRDLTVGTSTAGGHTVSTDLLAASFIDLLRNRMVLQRLGVTVLNGLVGNIAIPRQTSGATAYWVAESGAPTESAQAFDQVTMTPKTVGAYTDYSRKLLLQSSIEVEAFVRNDLTRVLGLEIDRAGLYGSGSSNQPEGVKNLSGINTKDFAAAAPTFAEIVELETLVAADNADIGTLAYLVNATGRGSLKTTEKASSTGQFIWEAGNTVNGYRTEVSNQVESGDYWFANWADLVMGFWSGLDLMVDPYTGSTSGTVRIVGLQDVDVAGRHPVSFCRGNNTL